VPDYRDKERLVKTKCSGVSVSIVSIFLKEDMLQVWGEVL